MKNTILVLGVVLLSFISNANCSTKNVSDAIYKIKKLNTSLNSKWLALTHFEKPLLRATRSSINETSFFLSPNGKFDPQAELEYTVESFINSPSSQCKYPARAMWLKTVLPEVNFSKVECEDYQAYLEEFNPESVSVVYASGYLGNPASMFGHVLLKFNRGGDSDLLDNTFSYGASVPDKDNKLAYIVKGITGKYDGHFARQKYHHQNLVYTESELRDLWEYRLKLTDRQVEFLLAHLWEIRNTSMEYYFFKENCSYQLAKLLELVIEQPLVTSHKAWSMPYDLIVKLNKVNDGQYIDDNIYHGSRQELLYSHFAELNNKEKSAVKSIIAKEPEYTLQVINLLGDEQSAKRVIDTMYDYYAFIENKNEGLSEAQENKKKILLTERFTLPPSKVKWTEIPKKPPHEAQNSTLLQFTSIYNEYFGSGALLRFRANYYDFLNVNAARIPYSQLSALDIRLLYTESSQDWSLRELTLFDIRNLNASKTGLKGDTGYAWAISTGYNPDSMECSDCSSPYIEFSLGKSKSLSTNLVAYTAIASEIRFLDASHVQVKSGPEIGGVLNLAPNWATSLKLGRAYNLSNIEGYENYLVMEQRFFNSNDFDVRTSVTYKGNFEYSINLSTYW